MTDILRKYNPDQLITTTDKADRNRLIYEMRQRTGLSYNKIGSMVRPALHRAHIRQICNALKEGKS